MRRTVPPSAEIEKRGSLAGGIVAVDPQGAPSELAALGAKLVIQRAAEEDFDAFVGRARYERRPEAPPGKRNGYRPRRVEAAEGELEVELPQVREAAEPFTSKLFPRASGCCAPSPLSSSAAWRGLPSAVGRGRWSRPAKP